MTEEELKKMKEELTKPTNKTFRKITNSDYLSTGSTLLNLACSDKHNGGFLKGTFNWLTGDSTSGKTFLSLTCFAEACNNPEFDNYRLVYDNVENGALMDIEKFFGPKAAERIEAPSYIEDEPCFSQTIEEFYFHLDDMIKENEPFIYVLDSMDGLTSKSEGEKFEETKQAYRKGNKTAGSYGDGKAKINSSGLRKLTAHLRDTGSILIIVSQTRDNLLGTGKVSSGGRSLKFYAALQIASSVKNKLTKNVKGKKRVVGVLAKVETKKNRQNGIDHTVEIPIYNSYGIDDIGSCITWLVDEGHWKMKGRTINAEELEISGTEETLAKAIEEDEEKLKKLKRITNKVWTEIREGCSLKRKKRYE